MDDIVISVSILLFAASGNCSMRVSKYEHNLCDKTKNETCRYIWQDVVGNQHICSYCPHNFLNDENSKNHQCIQNNLDKRDPVELENNLFPYCYSNVPGAIVPSCGKLPNVTYGEWYCCKFFSLHNITVYYTCKLICVHRSASVHYHVTVVRCNENRKWNLSLDTLTCVNKHLQPDIYNYTKDMDSNEATEHNVLITVLPLLLIIIVIIGMVIIVILLVYFCFRSARSRRHTPVLSNHDNASSPKTHVMTNGCSLGKNVTQGSDNASLENIALIPANKSLPGIKSCDSQERSHNVNSYEDNQSDTNDPDSIHSTLNAQSDHNHCLTYIVEKDRFSSDQSKSNSDSFHVTTESEQKEGDQEKSNNQSADKNHPESKYAAQGFQSDHKQHKTYAREKTDQNDCQDSFRIENEQSITDIGDLHVGTEPEHKDDQSLEHLNKLLDSYHGMRISSLMNLNSES